MSHIFGEFRTFTRDILDMGWGWWWRWKEEQKRRGLCNQWNDKEIVKLLLKSLGVKGVRTTSEGYPDEFTVEL